MIPSSVDRCGMWNLTGGEVVGGGFFPSREWGDD